jgi:hypothetical protein
VPGKIIGDPAIRCSDVKAPDKESSDKGMFEARADAAPIVESLESLTPFIWSVDKL